MFNFSRGNGKFCKSLPLNDSREGLTPAIRREIVEASRSYVRLEAHGGPIPWERRRCIRRNNSQLFGARRGVVNCVGEAQRRLERTLSAELGHGNKHLRVRPETKTPSSKIFGWGPSGGVVPGHISGMERSRFLVYSRWG
jgi:hypothetical protein